MNTTEKRFEDKLIMALRDAGFNAFHPNIMNKAGWPDIHAAHNSHLALIECKITEKMEDLIWKSFEPTQAPFYIDWFKSGGGDCIWIGFDHFGQSHLCLIDRGMMRDWKEYSWNNLLENSVATFTGPVWYLATQLRGWIEKEHG